ncbi:hypothetical protein Nepgr_033699 [Nepenthes gracilis]|uniref:Uncharacterized protein n=1 Tax=Nepenthes gracilis TaxID=150966 RepID=A0AAD3TLN0_NEPGR|nr:hypothetical protein Nepgr_033699 [Nepenthes gracilis]
MIGMKKSVGEGAPSVQAIEEVVEPVPNIQIPDKNIGSELAMFSRLPTISGISIEPRMEEASRDVVIGGSTQSVHIQDQIQEVASTLGVFTEDVVNPSMESAKIRSQPAIHPPRLDKEMPCPEIPTSDPMNVQERNRPDWMNTPASSTHPSPGGNPDRPSTPSSRISLNEAALNACFIQASFG